MRNLCLTVLFLFFLVSQALGYSKCMTKHVQDAMILNHQRMPIYAKASNNKSLKISKKLISFEESMSLHNWFADRWAAYFHSKNIPILCNDLVDMKLTPAMPAELPLKDNPDPTSFVQLNIKDLQLELRKSLAIDLSTVQMVAKKYLLILKHEPRLNCMTRHFLESIALFSKNGQIYMKHENAQSQLRFFLKLTIKAHIKYLKIANELDTEALSLQTRGIPILCQDLPHIPN